MRTFIHITAFLITVSFISVKCTRYTTSKPVSSSKCLDDNELQKDNETQVITLAETLFDNFWEWKINNYPQFATKIGISKYDDRVNEKSFSSYRRRATDVRRFLKEAKKLRLSLDKTRYSEHALSMELLENGLKQYLIGVEFNTYVWPISIIHGPQYDTWYLLTQMNNKTVKDMENIISRIYLFAQQIDEDIALMKEGIRRGQTLYRTSIKKLVDIFHKIATSTVEENEFFKGFYEKPSNISDRDWLRIKDDAKIAIISHIQPAYMRLHDFLKTTYLPKCRLHAGISSLPNGRRLYQALLNYHTTTDLSAEKIHQIGLDEVARITSRMESVRDAVRFNGSLDEFRFHLQTDQSFGFDSKEDMLNYYKGLEVKVMKIIHTYFNVLPKTPFVIESIPEDLASFAAIAYYIPPTKNSPGKFFVNTRQPHQRRRYIAVPVFLHEAIPGHHFQISLKIENGSPFTFRRYFGLANSNNEDPAAFSTNTAYREGWGLYTEYLGEEMGMYSDPLVLFGRLATEMLRACRLVIDTGMHALGWSRKRAVNYLRRHTAMTLHVAMSETDRYIARPGLACAYKIGELKFRGLRKMAHTELGEKFDIRKFHDFILSLGDIPLSILERQLKAFIEREKQKEDFI